MLKDVNIQVLDGLMSLAAGASEGVHIKIGVSPKPTGAAIEITSAMASTRVLELLGNCPLADAVLESRENGAGKIICLPINGTAGTVGTVEKVGIATCVVSGSPTNAFDIVLKFTKGGTFNEAVLVISLDGGTHFGKETTLPVSGSYTLPSTGLTVAFTLGEGETIATGDCYSFKSTAPTPSNAAILTAAETLRNQKGFEFVHVVGSTTRELWASVSSLQKQLLTLHKKPIWFLLEAAPQAQETLPDYVTALTTAAKTIGNTDLQVCAARVVYRRVDGITREINAASILCGLYARARVNESIGKTASFALSTAQVLALRPVGIEDYLAELDEARLLTLRAYDGLDGFYVTDAKVLSPEGSDYRSMEEVRVKNKIIREVRTQLLEKMHTDVDPSRGQAAFSEIAKFAEIPLDEMIRTGELSSASVEIPDGQNILETEELSITVYFTMMGRVKGFNLAVGMVNPYK